MVRLLLIVALPLVAVQTSLAGGFTIPKNTVYSKISYNYQQSDKVFDHKGARLAWQQVSPLETGLDADLLNLFVGWGISDRFSATFNIQYMHNVLDNQFAEPSVTDGITDVWLNLQYLLGKRRFQWVLAGGVKLPQQENVAQAPQITNGERAYDLSLGAGYGAARYYLEAELAHIYNEGYLNNVVDFGVPYENEWRLVLKAGFQLGQRWQVEPLFRARRTTADLDGRHFIAGIYNNADEDYFKLDLNYQCKTYWGLGLSAGQTTTGKNVLEYQTLGMHGYYRWSW